MPRGLKHRRSLTRSHRIAFKRLEIAVLQNVRSKPHRHDVFSFFRSMCVTPLTSLVTTMATLSEFPKSHWRIQYVDIEGRRQTLRLGKCSKSSAEIVRHRVGLLLTARRLGVAMDSETAGWVNSLGEPIRGRLGKTGLIGIAPTVKRDRENVSDYFTTYIDRRKRSVKPATVLVWTIATNGLVKSLPPKLKLSELNASHGKQWLDDMQAAGIAPTTQYKRLTIVRQILGDAVSANRLAENPFASIKISKPKRMSNVEVPSQSISKLLPHLDLKWQAIVILARYGALRCPSEVLSLKWEHIDVRNRLMLVPEPKTERHSGRGLRKCPLFPEVHEALKRLKHTSEYVIDLPGLRAAADRPTGWANANLRTHLLKRMEAANIKPWPRLFHSMRATRQTELEREFGRTAACAWVGNTESVAEAHYLMVTSADWHKATKHKNRTRRTGSEKAPQSDAKSDVAKPRNGGAGKVKTQKKPEKSAISQAKDGE